MTYSIAFYVDSVDFTVDVVNGTASLGGSESACLGLARALSARGHTVSIYATKLDPAAKGRDRWGVTWEHAEELREPDGHQDWDVFCALRMPGIYYLPRMARLRLLWNQDLMNAEPFKNQIMSFAWAYDAVVYVSEYHRAQWEDWIPELKSIGYVTKNSFDPRHLPATVEKDPFRIIHISRPERGLEPLLKMWPALKKQEPRATLQICRYSSMYDKDGWGQVCKSFDRKVEEINKITGGITLLGELGKAELYQAISNAGVMWYPGVQTFAETSCLAAIEAQACGTLFVGSLKGALPETIPNAILIHGDAYSTDYQRESIASVIETMHECAAKTADYRALVAAGKKHVEAYTHAAVAAEWERWLDQTFTARFEANKIQVLRQLMHYDDHTAALPLARELMFTVPNPPMEEAWVAAELCQRVIAGKEQVAEDYAERAAKPLIEAEKSDRFKAVIPKFEGCTHVIDLACGPGSFALALAKHYPDVRVTGIDYAPENIETAKQAAEAWGVADRCTFLAGPVYDFDTRQPVLTQVPKADGAFIGEFLEHCAAIPELVDAIESKLAPDSPVVFTVPYGPLGELIPRDIPHRRGHVHHFRKADVVAVFGAKQDFTLGYLGWPGISPRGYICGNWLIGYRTSGVPTGRRPYEQSILTTRPRQRVSVGIIARNAAHEIGKCLDSVWGMADEIVVGLCESTDGTQALCESYDSGFKNTKIRTITLPDVSALPGGFSEARNAVLAECTSEWFFWIDTDEILIHGYAIGKYVEGGVYNGYVVRQNHLQLDAANHYDVPTRLFRRLDDIQFYGVVHEQPQQGDCNGDITPALEISDTQIAHMGYLVSTIRRVKLFERNLPLVARDQQQFPERRLGKLLVARDCVHLGDESCRVNGDQMSPEAECYYRRAIDLFTEHFKDPSDKFHELARPFYERALQALGMGTEVEWALAGKPGGLNGTHAKPHRFWVQDDAELKLIVEHRLKKAYQQMTPTPVHVDPYESVADLGKVTVQ